MNAPHIMVPSIILCDMVLPEFIECITWTYNYCDSSTGTYRPRKRWFLYNFFTRNIGHIEWFCVFSGSWFNIWWLILLTSSFFRCTFIPILGGTLCCLYNKIRKITVISWSFAFVQQTVPLRAKTTTDNWLTTNTFIILWICEW